MSNNAITLSPWGAPKYISQLTVVENLRRSKNHPLGYSLVTFSDQNICNFSLLTDLRFKVAVNCKLSVYNLRQNISIYLDKLIIYRQNEYLELVLYKNIPQKIYLHGNHIHVCKNNASFKNVS